LEDKGSNNSQATEKSKAADHPPKKKTHITNHDCRWRVVSRKEDKGKGGLANTFWKRKVKKKNRGQ